MDRRDKEEDEKREQEIAGVIREETDYLWLIRNADEATFRKALSDLGWKPGSPEFERRVRAWRELRRPSS